MEFVNDALTALKALPPWGWGAIALGVFLFAVGWMLGRAPGSTTTRVAPRRPEAEVAAMRDLKAGIARLEGENAALSNFFLLLPDFTKEINSRMDRRAIAAHIMKITERLFAPTQVLLFFLDEKVNKLILNAQRGRADDVKIGFQVDPGEGRIGWVAEHKVPMEVNDFIREMRHSGASLDVPAHFRFKTELCAPLVHEGKAQGVISVGGITRHYKYEKTMLALIADLGSIAIKNTRLFSQVQEMANSDGLTKLFNKRFFMEKLSQHILDAEQGHYPVSLFIFDLDHFKHYNDTQGHLAGDEVLKLTGQILREMVRPDDVPARYGGEEFIVILPQAPKDGAMVLAERIRARIEANPFANRESQPLKTVSLSGGVATFPDDGRTGPDLIAAADAALYRAKKAGRNRVFRSEPKYFSDGSEEVIYNVSNS
ncbi:MAG TPA: sensor domain-containing diguanylate cyclase [Candidatus Polarisedimenticolia bacterium]|nr:sensor domain-containing diguanylate cyclase [Candidatus Polarisedimenticolia bacterium]